MLHLQRDKYEKALLTLARSITVGAAYVSATPIPGLTSSFVAIFTSLLPFDMLVASARPPFKRDDWRRFITVLRPRVLSTAVTLLKGVAIGAAVGISTLLGVPDIVGAVLTVGMAYVWARRTPYAISSYVAILSGLALFERLSSLEIVATVPIVTEIVGVILRSGGGTFLALLAGWGVGFITGSITRTFLSRPYRSVHSAAYDLPMEMRPFNEVLHVGGKSVVVTTRVEAGAAAAGKSLADMRLRDEWNTTVLSIKRGDEEIVMPRGAVVLQPEDGLTLLTEEDASSDVFAFFEARRAPADSTAKSSS